MKIRSITFFNGRQDARMPEQIAKVGAILKGLRQRLTDAGYEVQTVRLALAQDAEEGGDLKAFVAAQRIEKAANDSGIDYVSLGPVRGRKALQAVDELIGGTQSVFTSVVLDKNYSDVAKAVKKISLAVPNGFGNLRFAALAQCGPGIPFFPAAYAKVDDYHFSLAMECADLAVLAAEEVRSAFPVTPKKFEQKRTQLESLMKQQLAQGNIPVELVESDAVKEVDRALERLAQTSGAVFEISIQKALEEGVVRRVLRQRIETHAARLDIVLQDAHLGAEFAGCDWSLATHPDERSSVGAAIEMMTGRPFGDWKTLTAVAALTGAIRDAKVRHVGFSGVFMPVLEDAILAQRGGPEFDLQKMLLYSSVCGTGLDTVPLAGDVAESAIAAVLMDVATLAELKGKPLTARLMPIPGMKAGDMTKFDFPFLVNGRVFDLR